MVTVETTRKVEKILRESDEALSTNAVNKELGENGGRTDPDQVREALEYLAEKGIAEKEERSDSNFEKNNPYNVYLIEE